MIGHAYFKPFPLLIGRLNKEGGGLGTIAAVVNALAKAGIVIDENRQHLSQPKGRRLKEEAPDGRRQASSALEERR